jgi:hypothetical protein
MPAMLASSKVNPAVDAALADGGTAATASASSEINSAALSERREWDEVGMVREVERTSPSALVREPTKPSALGSARSTFRTDLGGKECSFMA